jgi:hypothetical protein
MPFSAALAKQRADVTLPNPTKLPAALSLSRRKAKLGWTFGGGRNRFAAQIESVRGASRATARAGAT